MSLLQKFQALQQTSNQNVKDAVAVFKQFQLELIRNGHKLTSPQELKAAMQGLEIGAQIAMSSRDLLMFDRVINQLKQYYLMAAIGSSSSKRQQMIGLYLMYLLTENRLGDFHVEIELLSFSDLENKFVQFPMQIEQFMMEGSYAKIFEAKSNPPDTSYTILLNKLGETVRSEISLSLQTVHSQIPLNDALKMLSLNDVNTLRQHIKNNQLNWTINGAAKTLNFTPPQEKTQQLDAAESARDMLEFTSNIETIV